VLSGRLIFGQHDGLIGPTHTQAKVLPGGNENPTYDNRHKDKSPDW